MMDAKTLQERIAKVESKRALLLKFQADPTIGTLSLDVDQALIEMNDLMAEFKNTFPTGSVEPPIDLEWSIDWDNPTILTVRIDRRKLNLTSFAASDRIWLWLRSSFSRRRFHL